MNQPARSALPDNQFKAQPAQRPVPIARPAAPAPGEPQRDAINSIISQMTQDTCAKIAGLRDRLDELQRQVINGAADAQATLNEQIAVRIKVTDEIEHMARVIDDIAARGRDD